MGTRDSQLALQQTHQVQALLRQAHPGREFTLKLVKTTGDKAKAVSLSRIGGRGVFVKELESALLEGEIDLAVHSLKDMPGQLPPGLTLGAIVERGETRDALICPAGHSLDTLPQGASVGTGSPRRVAQLRAYRPDLATKDLRGNVDTRLRRAARGEFDAIVLAAAGLERLGRQAEITQYLDPNICLPAVGQGAMAVEVRAGDAETAALVAALDHGPSRAAVTAERAFLQGLGGGCQVPIAALARLEGEKLHLEGLVASPDGKHMLRLAANGKSQEAEALGQELARRILHLGGQQILEGHQA